VENANLVVFAVHQLKKCSVGVDSQSFLFPQRQVFRVQSDIFFEVGQLVGADKVKEEITNSKGQGSGDKTFDGYHLLFE
jgi:hypothetical protein